MLSLSRVLSMGLLLSSMPGCLIASGALFKFCGDGVINADDGELCDDGNNIDDDECSNACLVRVVANEDCGDGVLRPGDFCFDDQDSEDVNDAAAQGELVLVDLDEDGLLDACYSLSGGEARVVENQSANEVFAFTPRVVPVGDNTTSLFGAADLDGDSNLDLITGDDDAVGVAPHNGGLQFGAFTESVSLDDGGGVIYEPTSALALDLGGSGELDIVGTTKTFNDAGDIEAQLFVSVQDAGTFAPFVSADFPDEDLLSLVSGDFGLAAVSPQANNNLVISAAAVVAIDDQNIVGAFTIGANPVDLAVADINEDNDDDLVSANDDGVTILFGDGTGDFSAGSTAEVPGGASSVALADLDGDGAIDAVASSGSDVFVFPGANASFGAFVVQLDAGAFVSSVQIGDMNDDGVLDIAALTSDGLRIFFSVF